MKSMTFAATGDSFIVRQIPPQSPGRQDLSRLLQEADVRFTNLETVLRREEGFPSAQSGGTWASSPPEVLSTLQAYGFNLISCANNHSCDYSYGGLESTCRYLDEAGLVHAGTGRTLAEANAAGYLDTPGGRVALISATSTFHESWIAGDQRKDGPGRPGVNPLRFGEIHRVPAEKLNQLRELAGGCAINEVQQYRVESGFSHPDPADVFRFGQHLFALAEPGREGPRSTPHAGDQRRILQAVTAAARQAEVVLVSIHAHEWQSSHHDQPADFLREFSRACIEAGAHAVIGHGPHTLRGVEIHRERPIFYSLGNFIFHNESVAWQPADFYEKHHLDPAGEVSEAYAARSDQDRRGLAANPSVWHSVVAKWRMTDGRLDECVLHPVSLGFGEPVQHRGTPQLSTSSAALEEIALLSRSFGTEFKEEDNRLVWRTMAGN